MDKTNIFKNLYYTDFICLNNFYLQSFLAIKIYIKWLQMVIDIIKHKSIQQKRDLPIIFSQLTYEVNKILFKISEFYREIFYLIKRFDLNIYFFPDCNLNY